MPHFTTNDGVRLNYIERGEGAALLMIPGWSQSAAQFEQQVAGLSAGRRVIALDMRGHGDSEKPSHGYKIQRLAMDLRNAIEVLGLEQTSLLGHSMGCAVIWCYLDLFGSDGLERLVLVDQTPCPTARAGWSQQEKIDAGALFDETSLFETVDGLVGPEGDEATKDMVRGMFTAAYPAERLAWVVEQNLKLPRNYAAALLFGHLAQDWRDLIPRIDLPTLIIGGRASIVDWRAQIWMQRQIAGARLEFFEEADGGNHFMFMENPARFNRLVEDFLNEDTSADHTH